MGLYMRKWEKYRDKKAHEHGLGSPDSCHRVDFSFGFNAATEYWQKKIETLVEALTEIRDGFGTKQEDKAMAHKELEDYRKEVGE